MDIEKHAKEMMAEYEKQVKLRNSVITDTEDMMDSLMLQHDKLKEEIETFQNQYEPVILALEAILYPDRSEKDVNSTGSLREKLSKVDEKAVGGGFTSEYPEKGDC